MKVAPMTSTRGPIRAWIAKHAGGLGDDVLEVGSRVTDPSAWWAINRHHAQGQWTGMDMQPGHGVDVVANLHALPDEWQERFSGVLCSEVLEHVARPWVAMRNIHAVMRPGGLIIVTVPACFPLHAYPDDFYRYSESGIRAILEDAGFSDVATEASGRVDFRLNDHGESGTTKYATPMYTFAVGRA